MKRIIHVRVLCGDKYFVAECFDLPVVTQALTLDELTENVKEGRTHSPSRGGLGFFPGPTSSGFLQVWIPSDFAAGKS